MTVAELMAELSKLPPEQEVRAYEDGVGDDEPIQSVSIVQRGTGAGAYVVVRTWGV